MASINSVYTATAFNTDVDNDGLNPTQTDQLAQVDVTLVFDGVNFDPNALYDALDAQYGTVTSDKVPARGTYIFRIST